MAYVVTRGMGSDASEDLSYGTQAASVAVSGAALAGLIPLSAVPYIGPAIAAAAMIAQIIIKQTGCGQTCIQTSSWANQAEGALRQNIEAYFALPVPRSRSNQKLALQTFDQIWAGLMSRCGDPQWGNAGKRCISDRQAGACVWKQNNAGYPGGPAMGECWNWFNGYRDPITNDKNVVDDKLATTATDTVNSIFGSSSSDSSSLVPLLLLGGLIALGVSL